MHVCVRYETSVIIICVLRRADDGDDDTRRTIQDYFGFWALNAEMESFGR